MDKKSKEALRRYKKARQQAQSSSDSSESDSGSSSSSYSSASERKAAERHRKKKARRSSSSSADERRKREKREHCQKKLEAKRNHLKRKLKEAKLRKRAAAALSGGHSHRSLSPATQAKLKKLAERKYQRAASKERREREREKHRAAATRDRERDREHHRSNAAIAVSVGVSGGGSRSPTTSTKLRLQEMAKRPKSPHRMHHQLLTREKIIIRRDRTPSVDRERQRHDELRERERRERADREAAREKERAEALARCQQRQRERERIAREKMRRDEDDKKYGGVGGSVMERVDRGGLLPRPERELSGPYGSRERSLEALEHARHLSKRDLEYEREREYLRREREYPLRRRDVSPVVAEHFGSRLRERDPRELYTEEERERAYQRGYMEEVRHPREREPWPPRELREREMHDLRPPVRDFRDLDEHEYMYIDERERMARDRERERERERTLAGRGDWKNEWEIPRERDWEEAGPPIARSSFVGGPKRGVVGSGVVLDVGPPGSVVMAKMMPRDRDPRPPSEPDWDTDDLPPKGIVGPPPGKGGDVGHSRDVPIPRDSWMEHDQRDLPPQREKSIPVVPGAGGLHSERRWQSDWRDSDEHLSRSTGAPGIGLMSHHHSRGGRGYRRGGPDSHRPHPPPLMTLPVQPPGGGGGGFHGNPRFPNKRNMTYTNPNLIKKQHAALAAAKLAAHASAATAVAAAKAAAQSAATATTNPSILGQQGGVIRSSQQLQHVDEEGAKAADILPTKIIDKPIATGGAASTEGGIAAAALLDLKASAELSEISDSDDEILTKTIKSDIADDELGMDELGASASPATMARATPERIMAMGANTSDIDPLPGVETTEERIISGAGDDDEMLDFEEISDGELEEDARNKGVGDALGVDWASLIAETKYQMADANVPIVAVQTTTAKQKWQPHRIILDIGVSMRMAGVDYAKRLLTEAQQHLSEEELLNERRQQIKSELTEETTDSSPSNSNSNDDEDTQTTVLDMETLNAIHESEMNAVESVGAINVDCLHPLACVQVAERHYQLEERNIIANACGPNSRALSARMDLTLRRRLCGLPPSESDLPLPLPPVSSRLKALALAAFHRAVDVK